MVLIKPISGRRHLLLALLSFAVLGTDDAQARGRRGSGGGRRGGSGGRHSGSSGGCGSKGGPGYRKPNGKCAGWKDR